MADESGNEFTNRLKMVGEKSMRKLSAGIKSMKREISFRNPPRDDRSSTDGSSDDQMYTVPRTVYMNERYLTFHL